MLSFSFGKLAFRRDLMADIIPQKLRGQAFRFWQKSFKDKKVFVPSLSKCFTLVIPFANHSLKKTGLLSILIRVLYHSG